MLKRICQPEAIILSTLAMLAVSPSFAEEVGDPALAAYIAQAKAKCPEIIKKIAAERKKAQVAKSASADPQARKQASAEISLLDQLSERTQQLAAKDTPRAAADKEAYGRELSKAMGEAHVLTSTIDHTEHSAPSTGGFAHAQAVVAALTIEKADYLGHKTKGFDREAANVTAEEASVALNAAPPRNSIGTCFFCGSSAVVTGGYFALTEKTMEAVVTKYGVPYKGVVLEGIATGLGNINSAEYDSNTNALVLNGSNVYLLRIPPWTFGSLCRAIAADDRIGVSEEADHILVYGAKNAEDIYGNTDIARDLALADLFLRDVVFAENHWNKGYSYADGFEPKRPVNSSKHDLAVGFTFSEFRFDITSNTIKPRGERLSASVYPVSAVLTKDGGLPDYYALIKNEIPVEYVDNATYVASHASYFSREEIVARTFAYGEAASILRAIKKAGKDLNALAERGATP